MYNHQDNRLHVEKVVGKLANERIRTAKLSFSYSAEEGKEEEGQLVIAEKVCRVAEALLGDPDGR